MTVEKQLCLRTLKGFSECTLKRIIKGEVVESNGELLTQDPYHRHF